MDGQGFNDANWKSAKVWTTGCATRADVEAGAAVFALGDTVGGKPLGWTLPQPVIWSDEAEDFAALAVQAESHETEDGETLEALGLLLPTGRTVLGFVEDVEVVEASDPVWISLIEAELETSDDAPWGAGPSREDADQ